MKQHNGRKYNLTQKVRHGKTLSKEDLSDLTTYCESEKAEGVSTRSLQFRLRLVVAFNVRNKATTDDWQFALSKLGEEVK